MFSISIMSLVPPYEKMYTFYIEGGTNRIKIYAKYFLLVIMSLVPPYEKMYTFYIEGWTKTGLSIIYTMDLTN